MWGTSRCAYRMAFYPTHKPRCPSPKGPTHKPRCPSPKGRSYFRRRAVRNQLVGVATNAACCAPHCRAAAAALQAGEPPDSSAQIDDAAWHGQQNQWYADAVEAGVLPAPTAKARRTLWQQATKRYWCAARAAEAADGGSPALAERARDAAQRAKRKRPTYSRAIQHVVVQVGRKANPPTGLPLDFH